MHQSSRFCSVSPRTAAVCAQHLRSMAHYGCLVGKGRGKVLHGAGSSQHGSHTALSVETGELAKGGCLKPVQPVCGLGKAQAGRWRRYSVSRQRNRHEGRACAAVPLCDCCRAVFPPSPALSPPFRCTPFRAESVPLSTARVECDGQRTVNRFRLVCIRSVVITCHGPGQRKPSTGQLASKMTS